MNSPPIIDEEEAFDHGWGGPDKEKKAPESVDPPPRLRGDLLLKQLASAMARWLKALLRR